MTPSSGVGVIPEVVTRSYSEVRLHAFTSYESLSVGRRAFFMDFSQNSIAADWTQRQIGESGFLPLGQVLKRLQKHKTAPFFSLIYFCFGKSRHFPWKYLLFMFTCNGFVIFKWTNEYFYILSFNTVTVDRSMSTERKALGILVMFKNVKTSWDQFQNRWANL